MSRWQPCIAQPLTPHQPKTQSAERDGDQWPEAKGPLWAGNRFGSSQPGRRGEPRPVLSLAMTVTAMLLWETDFTITAWRQDSWGPLRGTATCHLQVYSKTESSGTA